MKIKFLAILVLSTVFATAQEMQIFHMSGAWLGVGLAEVTSDNMAALKLKEERGVEVATVSPDSPASKAGLKEHDVILEFNGARVESTEQFKRMISEMPAGRTVKLLISRDGATQTVSAKLEEHKMMFRDDNRNFRFSAPMAPTPPTPPTAPTPPSAPRAPRAPMARTFEWPNLENFSLMFDSTPRLGIEGEQIGSQLGEYFGVGDKGGVLVRSVTQGSAAEKAGIKAGDVITKVNGKHVEDMSDLREGLRDGAGKSLPIVLIRNKKEMTVTVKIEKPEESHRDSV
jgi:S1-C subfamily serine protease